MAVTVEEKIDGFVFTWTKGIGTVDGSVFTFTMGDMFDVKVERKQYSTDPKNDTNEWRIYAGHEVTISSSKVLITGVYFTDHKKDDALQITATSENFAISQDGNDWAFTINDPQGVSSISFLVSKQVQIKEMIISYVEK